jgi:hypothetical protein
MIASTCAPWFQPGSRSRRRPAGPAAGTSRCWRRGPSAVSGGRASQRSRGTARGTRARATPTPGATAHRHNPYDRDLRGPQRRRRPACLEPVGRIPCTDPVLSHAPKQAPQTYAPCASWLRRASRLRAWALHTAQVTLPNPNIIASARETVANAFSASSPVAMMDEGTAILRKRPDGPERRCRHASSAAARPARSPCRQACRGCRAAEPSEFRP